MKVERLPLSSAQLVTVDEQVTRYGQFAGCFVRLRPTSAASDVDIKRLKNGLLKAGALAVRVVPRPPGGAVQLSGRAQLVQNLAGAGDAIPPVRELMRALVDASSSDNKSELNELLVRLADKEGL